MNTSGGTPPALARAFGETGSGGAQAGELGVDMREIGTAPGASLRTDCKSVIPSCQRPPRSARARIGTADSVASRLRLGYVVMGHLVVHLHHRSNTTVAKGSDSRPSVR